MYNDGNRGTELDCTGDTNVLIVLMYYCITSAG